MNITDDPKHDTPVHSSSQGSPPSSLHPFSSDGRFRALYRSWRAVTAQRTFNHQVEMVSTSWKTFISMKIMYLQNAVKKEKCSSSNGATLFPKARKHVSQIISRRLNQSNWQVAYFSTWSKKRRIVSNERPVVGQKRQLPYYTKRQSFTQYNHRMEYTMQTVRAFSRQK